MDDPELLSPDRIAAMMAAFNLDNPKAREQLLALSQLSVPSEKPPETPAYLSDGTRSPVGDANA